MITKAIIKRPKYYIIRLLDCGIVQHIAISGPSKTSFSITTRLQKRHWCDECQKPQAVIFYVETVTIVDGVWAYRPDSLYINGR